MLRFQQFAICIEILLHAVLLSFLGGAFGQGMPRFKPSGDNLLVNFGYSITWNAGGSSSIAILNPITSSSDGYKILELDINLINANISHARLECQFDQSNGAKEASEVSLAELESNCSGEHGQIKLEKHEGKFELTVNRFQVPPNESLRAKITVRIKVKVPHLNHEITSNPLYIYVPGNIINLEAEILTEPAINLLSNLDKLNTKLTHQTIDFLRPEVVEVIKQAPSIFHNLIRVAAILRTNRNKCNDKRVGVCTSAMFGGVMNQHAHDIALQKSSWLDITSGKFYYYPTGVRAAVPSLLNAKGALNLDINPVVLLGNLKLNEILMTKWKPFSNITEFPGDQGQNCYSESKSTNVKVFSNIGSPPLLCPIVCSSAKVSFKFSSPGGDLEPATDEQWNNDRYTNDKLVMVHPTGTAIKLLPGVMHGKHSGAYRCEAGGVNFTFNVRILLLPTIKSDQPDTVYAMEGEGIQFTCVIEFYGFSTRPKIETNFWRPECGNLGWINTTEADIKNRQPLTLTRNTTGYTTELILTVQKVETADHSLCRNSTLRFVCSSSLDNKDAKEIGMEEYNTERDTNVFHIYRPNKNTFIKTSPTNCCFDGVTFDVSIKPEFAAHLKAVRVHVKAYFKVLNESGIQEDAGSLNVISKNYGKTGFDETENRLYFDIHKANSTAAKEAVLKDMNKASGIRAIFQFHYPAGSKLGSLHFIKSGKHHNCDAAPECFFSTEFDKELANSLTFAISQPPTKLKEGGLSSKTAATTDTTAATTKIIQVSHSSFIRNQKSLSNYNSNSNSAVSSQTSWMIPIILSVVVTLLIIK